MNVLIEQTGAKVVLTSSRRMGKTVAELQSIMQRRGFRGEIVGKVDEATEPRGTSRTSEIESWLSRHGIPTRFVILDDDGRLAELESHVRDHWVRTTYHRGFDAQALTEAFGVLGIDQ